MMFTFFVLCIAVLNGATAELWASGNLDDLFGLVEPNDQRSSKLSFNSVSPVSASRRSRITSGLGSTPAAPFVQSLFTSTPFGYPSAIVPYPVLFDGVPPTAFTNEATFAGAVPSFAAVPDNAFNTFAIPPSRIHETLLTPRQRRIVGPLAPVQENTAGTSAPASTAPATGISGFFRPPIRIIPSHVPASSNSATQVQRFEQVASTNSVPSITVATIQRALVAELNPAVNCLVQKITSPIVLSIVKQICTPLVASISEQLAPVVHSAVLSYYAAMPNFAPTFSAPQFQIVAKTTPFVDTQHQGLDHAHLSTSVSNSMISGPTPAASTVQTSAAPSGLECSQCVPAPYFDGTDIVTPTIRTYLTPIFSQLRTQLPNIRTRIRTIVTPLIQSVVSPVIESFRPQVSNPAVF